MLIDATLQIDWCNPVAEQHLGISLRADQGLRVTNLVRDPEFVGYMTSARFDQPLVFQPMRDRVWRSKYAWSNSSPHA